MLTWDELVDICSLQMPVPNPVIFERALKDLAEPEFARITECLEAEKLYTTVVDTNNYELPMGVVRIKMVYYKGRKLDPVKVENLKSGEQYQSGDGTTLRTGRPQKYYTQNDRLYLVPCPTEAAALRVHFATLPVYTTRKYIAQTGTTTTILYLDIGIPGLATDTVTFSNVTRSLTGACSAYSYTGNRHKYTVAAMAGQVAGDIIEIPTYPYIPSIPEIDVMKLIPYALAMGYSFRENTTKYERKMAEFFAGAESVKNERAMRAYPEDVVTDNPVIR